MPDYSSMSDADLLKLVQPPPAPMGNYSNMSDADLMKIVQPSSGIGDFFKSVGTGAVQGVSNILSNVGQAAQIEMSQPIDVGNPQETQQAIEQNVTGKLHQPQGVSGQFGQTIGGALPYALTQPMASLGGLGTALAGSVLSGAGNEAGGQLTKGSSIEPYVRLVGGMSAPLGLGSVSKFVTPFPASPTRLNAAASLESEGIAPTAGQTVGSDRLMRMERQLGGSEAFDQSAEDYTQAALRKGGTQMQPNQNLSDALNAGFENNSAQYKSLAANNPSISLDTNAKLEALQHLQNYTSKVEGGNPASIVKTYADRIVNSPGMTGTEYQNLRSEIGRDARGVSNNPNLQQSLYGLQHSLDDAAERSIAQTNPADLGKWQEARQQYRNLLVLQNAAGKSGEAVAQNNITPGNLKSSADSVYGKNAYARGRGDFTDIAKSGYILTPPKSSGTAENILAQNLHAGIPALAGMFAGVGSHLAGAGPEISIPGMFVGAAAPRLAGKAMMSQPIQSYLKNQLIAPYKGAISETAKRTMLNALLYGSNSQRTATP